MTRHSIILNRDQTITISGNTKDEHDTALCGVILFYPRNQYIEIYQSVQIKDFVQLPDKLDATIRHVKDNIPSSTIFDTYNNKKFSNSIVFGRSKIDTGIYIYGELHMLGSMIIPDEYYISLVINVNGVSCPIYHANEDNYENTRNTFAKQCEFMSKMVKNTGVIIE